MVCRSTPGNSAITTLARTASNLHDVQVLSLFHEVRSEAPRSTVAPHEAERNRFITEAYQRVYTVGLNDRRRVDLGNRFDAARTQDVDGRTYYAWRNIEQRAILARAAMDSHFATIANRHNATVEQVEAAFNEMMNRDHRVNGEVPAAPEHVDYSTDNLPRDRGTRYALAMLHTNGPAVTRSPGILRVGYMRIQRASERIAAAQSTDPANQCPDCGQFAGTDHTCPDTAAADTLNVASLMESARHAVALNDDEVAAANAEMEAAYLRNQGFVPEETGTADALADSEVLDSSEYDSDGAPRHDDECGDDIRFTGTCRHGNAFSTPAAPPAGERIHLRTDAAITAEAERNVSLNDDGTWVNTEGFAYASRDLTVRSAAAAIMTRELRNAIRSELGSAVEADQFLATVDARISAHHGQWRTPDGGLFRRHEDAVLHEAYRDPAGTTISTAATIEANRRESVGSLRCDDCGQFMSDNHVCDPADVNANTTSTIAPAPQNDPLAEWERELLDGAFVDPDPTDTQSAAEAAANAPLAEPEPVAAREPVRPARTRNPLRTYRPDENTDVRIMNASAVRATLRANPNDPYALDDVTIHMITPMPPDEFGSPGRMRHTVTGSLTVTNTGQRRTRNRDRLVVSADPTPNPNAEIPLPGEGRTLRCTCRDYRTNYDCEHVRQAVEHVQALLNQRDPVAVAPAAAMDSVGAALRTEYDASLAASQEAREGFAASGDNVSYGDDMAAFQSAWDEAKAQFESGDHALPYMYENATNGLGARDGGRSIGIEIEVDFPDDMTYTAKQRVAREIFEAGLSDSAEVRPWHWRARQTDVRGRAMGGGYTDNPNSWTVEFDRSVDDVGGQRGCEIVSPILYDTPDTWRNLKTICDIVERNGGAVTPRTGLHINIGAADFDHTVGNHNRLVGLANAYEDVIVRAAHNPQAGPNHRGRDYCRPMTMPEEGFTSIRQAQRSIDPQNYEGSSHRAMINLDHVPAEGAPVVNSTRVEVRIFDGTIDPGRIQANVKMSLGMVNAAVRGVEVPREPERAGTHRTTNAGANGRMRRLRGEEWENDTKTFRAFADTLFSREADKKQLTYAFAASRWQRR